MASFIGMNGTWNWDIIVDYISQSMILSIVASNPPQSGRGDDEIFWQGSPNSRFTVSSAYELLVDGRSTREWVLWKVIWKWHGPQRNKTFLWLVGHERLMTNEVRRERGLSSFGMCPLCSLVVETTMHVLRDCVKAKQVWVRLVPQQLQAELFGDDRG